MVALLTVKNSAGVVGQCDAKCYDAHDAECLCICAGKNHGAGFERALEQSAELELELDAGALRAFAKQNGASVRGLELELGGELEPRQRRRWLTTPADVRRVRARLELTQAEFAARLGVSRRTVIRAELRGFEIPWRSSSRDAVREAWSALQTQAAELPTSTSSSRRSPAARIPAKVSRSGFAKSRKPKRDTLAAIARPAIAVSSYRKRLRDYRRKQRARAKR